MQLRFLLGPSGSGKTFRCLSEAQRQLAESVEGPPLLFIAPKQMTYQLERQLLAGGDLQGYTRLQILSFERLARFILGQLQQGTPQMLNEEGRVMVLRALLARRRNDLKLFRASARLTGFAQQLSEALRELQRNQLTPDALKKLAAQVKADEALAHKISDLATLLEDYLAWLSGHGLQDADSLIELATARLKAAAADPKEGEVVPTDFASPENRQKPANAKARRMRRADSVFQLALFPEPVRVAKGSGNAERSPEHGTRPRIGAVWVDGFAEWAPQEIDLLSALLPFCEQGAITFCLEKPPGEKASWLSGWSVTENAYRQCRNAFEAVAEIDIETLGRTPGKRRFDNPVLAHVEECWAEPKQFAGAPAPTLGIVHCANPEAEAVFAAREILRHVRAGGRFRDVAVLVRSLELYQGPLQRVLARYGIPYFLDRREPVAHHPLAELTRCALRTVVRGWEHEDWFGALKTGLAPAADAEIDRLENEALSRGWQGEAWLSPIVVEESTELTSWLEKLQPRVVGPFKSFAECLGPRRGPVTGRQLAEGVRELWADLRAEERLQSWTSAEALTPEERLKNAVHGAVWEQMNVWLENVELAFADELLFLKEWLPIAEAGLSGLSVGLVPPALDQVLIGAVDRARNPEVRLALVLGLNESVFPASPAEVSLLSEADRVELEKHQVSLTANRHQISRERFYGYVACTRARERLVLTTALTDAEGNALGPSAFLSHIQRMFPSLEPQTVPQVLDWRESEHPHELVAPLFRIIAGSASACTEIPALTDLMGIPALSQKIAALREMRLDSVAERLRPELASRLFGPILRTSVSRLEQFAECPFKFFINSGLRADERRKFEVDAREQGSFQHDALALFHEQLHGEGKRWRDIEPEVARDLMGQLATSLIATYRNGLLERTEETRFLGRVMTECLQDFVETVVGWMRSQYRFEPVAVEVPFGDGDASSAWELELGNGAKLALRGRIDRVDVLRTADKDEAFCVVIDYKSSEKKLEEVLLANGLQLQLLAYLNVIRRWPNAREVFGAAKLMPAGVFYVSLRGKYDTETNRLDALEDTESARKRAYRHAGRFDVQVLKYLDSRSNAEKGDQFKYRITSTGKLNKGDKDGLESAEFAALLQSVEDQMIRIGREVFAGSAEVGPYRRNTTTACDQCSYASICRIDPWTHSFRILKWV
ncbi:MAG TPA: PD-(D/E)XK nuclease family protein [Candidatus Dormibacteraeota bacterium]|nr:PD-(D/E)XK nuclease family protein [Candidatus Dormibacteraeota bacterium]